MLLSMLQEAARRSPGRIALSGPDRAYTYRELHASTRQLAHACQRQGIAPGSRITLVTDHPAEFAIGFFAAASLGAVVLLNQPGLVPPEATAPTPNVDFALTAATPTLQQIHRTRQLDVPTIPIPLPSGKPVLSRATESRLRRTGPVLCGISAGSTATALRDQSQLVHEADSLAQMLGLAPKDHVLCSLPLEQTPGLGVGLLTAVRARASLTVCPLPQPADVRQALAAAKPTVWITDWPTLLGQVDQPHRQAIDSLRLILVPRSGSEPQELEARARFANKLVTLYHRCETGVIAINRSGGGTDCVGQPLPGVRVFLEPGERQPSTGAYWNFGSFVCLRGSPRFLWDDARRVNEPGIPGRIVVESLSASTTTTHGRFYTADYGYFDAAGALHLLPTPRSSTMRLSA